MTPKLHCHCFHPHRESVAFLGLDPVLLVQLERVHRILLEQPPTQIVLSVHESTKRNNPRVKGRDEAPRVP